MLNDNLKELERDYRLNPNDAELANSYSFYLSQCMVEIAFKLRGSENWLLAYKTLLNSLTEVYHRYYDTENIAENYLYGIACLPAYVSENVAEQILDIVRRFPNNEKVKRYCSDGLYFLTIEYDNRGDLFNAERAIKYFKMLYDHYPAHDWIAHKYAETLWYVYRNKGGFFEKRRALSDLKKIAEQHPDEQTMRYYRATKDYGAYLKEELEHYNRKR